MVSLYLEDLEDLELCLQNREESGLLIDDIVVIILLFADDMVILGKSTEELQYHLDLLHTYCSKWGSEVNAEKIGKGGVYFGRTLDINQETEVVNEFNYLGTIFKCTGNFSSDTEYIIGKSFKRIISKL